jgi:hypothetical protein
VPFERVEDHAIVRQRGTRFGVRFQRRRNETKRLGRLSLLVLEHAVKMQRVEMVRIGAQNGAVDRPRIVQPTLLMQCQRIPDRGRGRPWLRSCYRRSLHLCKLPAYAIENTRPIAEVRLTEQPGSRVPRAILAFEQPAEIRGERQQDPDRHT